MSAAAEKLSEGMLQASIPYFRFGHITQFGSEAPPRGQKLKEGRRKWPLWDAQLLSLLS